MDSNSETTQLVEAPRLPHPFRDYPTLPGMSKASRGVKPRKGHITVKCCPIALKDHIKPFADCVLRTLLPPNTYKRVRVDVWFRVKPEPNYESDIAVTTPIDFTKRYPSHFLIEIHDTPCANKMSLGEMLLTVGHELVHVKQFALRQLCARQSARGKAKWYWHGKEIKETNYWLLPHEIEAHGLERALVHGYEQHTGLDLTDWLLNLKGSIDPQSSQG